MVDHVHNMPLSLACFVEAARRIKLSAAGKDSDVHNSAKGKCFCVYNKF